ncbi:hypothetical protein RD110_16780 [Rhodoferax koreense]|uniref:Lysylphosphatidylglycerol synthetase n=1 Tax=Rhodoferax koreensis TaxID=1842727 RepID=A0A1P8K413_9BURK|nr:hypothetical protein RD110_16780 [Rhodoferax koreense]
MAAVGPAPVPAAADPGRRWWPWFKRGLALVFLALVLVLLVRQARGIAWAEVWQGLRALPLPVLCAAGGLALASHLLYACFDLLGRHYARHNLATPTVMAITFVSYAFNLSMGSLVGGVGFRYRLYAQFGLGTARTTRIVTMSMLTNWIGYLLLAGLMFMLFPPALPEHWEVDAATLPIAGAVMLALPVAYLLWCAVSKRRSWTLRGHHIDLPTLRLALLQMVMSCANWLIMAAVVYVLLQQRIEFPLVLGTLLAGAVAGVLAHVPAGLGVLEAVFVALLSDYAPAPTLVAAVLAYRALYYLLPLIIAVGVYVLLEARAKRLPARTHSSH